MTPKKILITALLFAVCLSISSPLFAASKTKHFLMMDTFVSINIRDKIEKGKKEAIILETTEHMKEMEKIFSYFDKSSELSRINKLKEGEELVLSDDMFTVLLESKELKEKTQGIFEINRKKGAWLLDPEKKTILIEKGDVDLDLGGIAKGYIVDGGISILKNQGIKSALINAGGDLYCLGRGPRNGMWKIGVRDPSKKEDIRVTFNIKDKGVATSGGYERYVELDGRKVTNIFDPIRNKKIDKIRKSVTVTASSCLEADALATTFYVLTPESALSLADSISGVDCVIIEESGKVSTSKQLKSRINLTKDYW